MKFLTYLSVALLLAISAQAQTITPQGRLTLITGVPVPNANATAATTVYYACYAGNVVPVGSSPANLTIGSCQISMGLAAANVLSGSVYDIFGVSNGGTLVICVGPAWSSTTSRGTGAGTTELQLNGGLWTNKNSLTHCYGGGSGTTDYGAVSANAGTYLGSLYATANGQTAMNLAPSGASGGNANVLGLYNAYQQVPLWATSTDTNASWNYTTGTWRSADNNNNNRITVLDGLGASYVAASYNVSGIGSGVQTGVNLDSTSATPSGAQGYWNNTSQAGKIYGGITSINLGIHYYQAMEYGAASGQFFGSAFLTLLMMD